MIGKNLDYLTELKRVTFRASHAHSAIYVGLDGANVQTKNSKASTFKALKPILMYLKRW
jgi:hypothetical protein